MSESSLSKTPASESRPGGRSPANRLVVVSNRLPMTLHRSGGRWTAERSSGGLVAALRPVMEQADGLWIGWPGDASNEDREGRAALLERWEHEHGLASVELPEGVGRAFYEGYANDTLWPLLHSFPSRVEFDAATYHAYKDANRRFADAVLARAREDDLVWVHDYQLFLLPAMLREGMPSLRIGFFLHVPFPSPEVFRVLPEREELLAGLLGSDVVGFQTHEHLGAFRRTILQVLGADSRMDRVDADGRPVALRARPIGIVPGEWDKLVGGEAVAKRVAELRRRHTGRQLILAVDRLDYTKGIPERLRAYRRMLASDPSWRGAVTLLQVAVPSRERIPRYAALRREVNELVGEINGAYGTADWSPVIYLRRPVARAELGAMYRAADVAWIGSLRDGMNLVAKEYVACQRDEPGVLVLSEFAGAASEMGEAIRINPYDETGTAEALARALAMPMDERAERHAALNARIRRNDAVAWAGQSVDDLLTATADRTQSSTRLPEPPVTAVVAAFRAAPRRLVAVDYDGTLVPLASRPADAVPPPAVAEVLGALSRRDETDVVVVSGRTVADLERWFGTLDGIWLAAEHGAILREPGGDWSPLRPGTDREWMPRIREVLEHYLARVPGSAIEAKEHSLAWHYRLVEPEFGEWIANEVATTLDEKVAGTELAVLRGSKVIEVRFAWANKGEVVGSLRSRIGPGAFELAIGDDRTDEDMFERLAPDGWTIRVGQGPTVARYRVGGPPAVLSLLSALGGSDGV